MIREVASSYASYFDKNKTVDRENWAVTLFATAATGLTKHHAKILVETVNEDGVYKKIMIDLVGGGSGMDRAETRHRTEGASWCVSYFGKIGVVKYDEKRAEYEKLIKHSGHSETWIRSAEKVQQMLDLVKEEKERYLAHPRPFSLLGRDSKLNTPIKVYKILDESLHDAYKKNPTLLIKIFNIATTYKTHLENGTFSDFLKTIHGGSLKSLETKMILRKAKMKTAIMLFSAGIVTIPVIIWAKIKDTKDFKDLDDYLKMKEIGEKALSTFSEEASSASSTSEEESEEDYNLSLSQEDVFLAKEKELGKFLLKVLNGFSEEEIERDSCFTWAREKLEMVDISLSGENPGLIITDTRNFLLGEKSPVSKFVDNANRLAKKLWKEDLSSNSYSTSDSEGKSNI